VPPLLHRRTDHDVGDHRRRREHAAAEVGQPEQRVHLASPPLLPLRVAVDRLRMGSRPLHPKREPGQGMPVLSGGLV